MRNLLFLIISSSVLILYPASVHAYIGPGAGFAFLSSFFILISTMILAIFILLLWPIRRLIRKFKIRKPEHTPQTGRVVVLGLDGLDPDLVNEYKDKGLLPNMSKLAAGGSFSPLQTTLPSMSPVAWSSFATGVQPSHHNIFDFLARDRRTYMPVLSSARIRNPEKFINLGKIRFPIEKPSIDLLRKSKTFWKVLGDYGVFSMILRVPITFPPEKFYGTCLSAMCVPDMLGTQGTRKNHQGRLRNSVPYDPSFVGGPGSDRM